MGVVRGFQFGAVTIDASILQHLGAAEHARMAGVAGELDLMVAARGLSDQEKRPIAAIDDRCQHEQAGRNRKKIHNIQSMTFSTSPGSVGVNRHDVQQQQHRQRPESDDVQPGQCGSQRGPPRASTICSRAVTIPVALPITATARNAVISQRLRLLPRLNPVCANKAASAAEPINTCAIRQKR